jgi:peptide/nickel transport system substrate-binding protein
LKLIVGRGLTTLAGILLLALSACGSGSSPNPVPSGGSAALDRTATLSLAWNGTPGGFDPAFALTTASANPWLDPLYDRLVKITNGTKLQPQLATSWDVSPDGASWTFKLRQGVKFQDGTPFDAATVVANIQRCKTVAGSTQAAAFKAITSVDKVDASTVKFNLAGPDPLFPYLMAAQPGALMASPAAFDKGLDRNPVGAGPYKLVQALSNQVTYQRDPSYWDAQAPTVAKLVIFGITDANAGINAFASGSLDALNVQGDLTRSKSLANGTTAKLVNAPVGSGPWALILNTRNPALNRLEVRQALSRVIDRKAIGNDLLGGACTPTLQPFWNGAAGFDPALDAAALKPPDPAKAKAALASAGVSNLTLKVVVPNVEPGPSIAQALQAQFAAIGVTLNLVTMVGVLARPEFQKGAFDASVLPANLSVSDPASYVRDYVLGVNNIGPVPPDMAQMASQASVLPLGSNERANAYLQISRYLADKPVASLPVCRGAVQWLAKPKVVGIEQLGVAVGYRGIGIRK